MTGSVVCAACGTPNPAAARFCNGCGAKLEATPARSESRRTVTIVFVDVAGSTALGERLDPESLRALIGEFFDMAKAIVERHGGVVEKFIGDAVMAVFGLPTLHEDDALRAVRAAAELQHRLAASGLADRLTIRTGINTGEVVAGDASAGQRLVTGDAVNTAARLEQAARAGEILLGLATHRLVRHAVQAVETPPVDARGKAEPVRSFRLESVDPAGELTARHLDAPLIGRERELGRLLRSYEDAVAERRCGLFTLLGPAGVGKSRLVHELVARIGDEARVLRGRSLPYGEGITYWPIAEMVRAAAGIEEVDDRETALAKLRSLVADDPEADEIADRVGAAIGVATAETDRDDVFRAVRRLFESLARDRPLVAVFDDLQWAEPTLIDLVEHVVDWSRGSPILVLVLARPDLLDVRPDWGGGKLDAQTVLLEGLGEAETRELAASLLGANVDRAVLDRIEAVAEGNPLFVEQLVAMLIEEGRLVRSGEGWKAASDLREMEVPPTISALLAARLDRLPRDERVLAERASVVGRVFERVAVAELSPEPDRPDVAARLRSLVRRELIRPELSAAAGDETFRFRHILIRDAAYESLSKRDRADLHGRFADWLEATTGGRLAEYEEIVGYHLDQAVRYRVELGLHDDLTAALRERAFRRLADAGRRASDRSDAKAAIRLLTRAGELGTADDRDRIETLLLLATAYLDVNAARDATRVLAEAGRAAESSGDRVRAARAELLTVVASSQVDPGISAQDLEDVASRHLELFDREGYEAGLIELWVARGLADLTRSQWARASEAYEQALVHAERAGSVGVSELVHTWLANALVWGPTDAGTGIDRCRELLGRTRSRRARAIINAKTSVLLAYAGHLDDARLLVAEANETLTDLGLGPESFQLGSAGEVEVAAGELERAVEIFLAGRNNLAAVGETGVRSTYEALTSTVLAWLGRDAEAIEFSIASERHAAADDMASQMGFHAGRALALAHLGRDEEAAPLAARAVALAETTDQINHTAQVLEVHAEVGRLAGRIDEARRSLDRAIDLYERKGNVVAGPRARLSRLALG
ncbi:MAG TPA: adenylate/guanylate cyclase domain-containing protein [Vitreimonas sp.]|nr:adenylate/guanylate cyclase domain-containing protein [Vitreimonas sp.]